MGKICWSSKELGQIVDYGVFVSDGASPNVWLTIEYENMAAMEQTKEKYDAVTVLAERYGDDEELDKISVWRNRRMVDNQRINQVNFKM